MKSNKVAVVGPAYWSEHVEILAKRLQTSATTIRDPSGLSRSTNDVMTFVNPDEWAAHELELRAALKMAAGFVEEGSGGGHRASPGVAPVEARLVYTVEEAATLLGISRSFAYEAVNAGRIPSLRIGRRILVPKVSLDRFLTDGNLGSSSQPASRTDE